MHRLADKLNENLDDRWQNKTPAPIFIHSSQGDEMTASRCRHDSAVGHFASDDLSSKQTSSPERALDLRSGPPGFKSQLVTNLSRPVVVEVANIG